MPDADADMTINVIAYVASALAALCWAPVARRQFVLWRARRNPISLAFLFVVLLVIYSNLIIVLGIQGLGSLADWSLVFLTASLPVCGYFHYAVHQARKRFPRRAGDEHVDG